MATGGAASAGQTTTIAADHNGNVYGNHNGTDWATYSGDPNDNTVNMTGGEVKNEGTYVKVLGAYVTKEKASGNQVIISGGKITNGDELAGAAAYDNAADLKNNTVKVTGSANIDADIDGALTKGTADSNHVIIEGGTFYASRGICGGRSTGGEDATNNTVTISGGTVTVRAIVGGFIDSSNTGGNVIGNTVMVSSDVTGIIYGGYRGGYEEESAGETAKNKVTLTGATVTGDVYGGYTVGGKGAVTGNIVTLNGATVTGDVYGGGTKTGTGDLVTGNTLNLFGANSAGGVVGNFEKIVLQNSLDVKYYDGTEEKTATYSLAWQDGATLLKAKEFKNCGTPDISGATVLKAHTTPGVMTLLQSATANNFVNLPVKYWDGTATLTAANPSVEVFRAAKTDSDSGVTLDYIMLPTVAVNAADSYKTVKYDVRSDATKLTFGDVEWKATGALIDHATQWKDISFDGATADAAKLAFTNPEAAAGNMTLISNASGLTITGADHSQGFTKEATNGVSLSATLTGKVSSSADAVNYAVTGTTLDTVDLSSWDVTKTADAVPDGWTAKSGGVAVTADSALAPTIDPGTSKDILTAATDHYFDNAQIADAIQYKAGASSTDTVNGVTLTGAESKGVKASAEGRSLVYARSPFDVGSVALGTMTWGTARDGSGATYNYAGISALDTSGLALTIADPESVKAGDSTTFLKANSTLKDMAAQTAKDVAYSVSPVAGASVSAAVRGSVSARGGSVVYTVTENKASKLTFTNVDWLDSGALIDHKTTLTNISFEGAEVDTAKISFTNVQTLDTDSKMTLVSGFGTSAGAINGSAFTVGKGTGEGHAYLESSDLRYVVTRGVSDDPTPPEDDNAIDEGGAPVSGKVDGDVTGGVAKNKGVAERNVKEVLPGAEITGSVTAAQSESGTVTENRATVTGGSVGGSVTGAVTGNGVATGNTADISGGCIVGNAKENAARVAGASTVDGTASGNHATISGSTVYGSVYGGVSQSGEVNANTATITGGMVTGDVAGGSTKQESPADNNTVTLEGQATISGNVFGGYSEQGSAAGNEVTVADATVEGAVYGGKSEKASEGNTVTMRGGTVNKLVGGGCETAAGNIVTVTGGTVENIFGAEAGTSAEDNAVSLGGGTVGKAVYGGYAESGTTRNNSVTLYGDADVSGANLFGGSLEATGNVLYVGLKDTDVAKSSAWTGGAVKNLANFETIRFDVVKWDTETAALTIADGTASDLSQTTVDATKVQFTDAESLKVNDTMTLLEDSAVEASKRVQEGNLNTKSDFTVGTTAQGTGTLSLDGDGNVIYTVKDVTSGEKAHSAVMGLEAGMAALAVGNDFIGDATAGLGLPANEGADGVSTFAKLGGGKLRQTTGSHVDVNTWNAIIAIGKKNRGEKSSFEYGAFFEYGSGNYTTHNGDERGDGSARYTGGGLLAKWKAKGGLYVEGSLRAGTVKDDAKNVLRDGAGVPYSYDTNAGYFGVHIGVGREIGLKGGNTLDVYGKYFYNRRNGVSFDAGGHYDLDAVTSSVLRVGARYTMKREAWNFYGGLAYEYEMDGEAKGRAGGLAIRGADIGGGSARLELGATMTPANSPWSLDLNLTGFAGKKRGLTGGVSAAFLF